MNKVQNKNSNTNNNLNNTNISSSLNSNDEFEKLKIFLLSSYPITNETLNIFKESLELTIGVYNISAKMIEDEIEANILSNHSKVELNEGTMKEIIKSCNDDLVNRYRNKKKPQIKKNNISNNLNNVNVNGINLNNNIKISSEENDNSSSMLISQTTQEIKIESSIAFNEKNHQATSVYNNNDINYTFFSNLEITEYSIIPKDEDVYFEEYRKYFNFYKEEFMQALGITHDNPLLDVDKFFLLVTFDNYEGKPLINDIVLIDPCRDYIRYALKIENENLTKDFFFFSGQIIYVEGHLKNKDIFAQKIIFGMSTIAYSVVESYVKGFYYEPQPYLIYLVNGPILNKCNLDLSILIQAMTSIANDNPHALILNGPILNAENSMIMSGDVRVDENGNTMNYMELFEFVLEKISKIFSNKRTTIILAPSLQDVTNYYPLPQPPFNFSNMKGIDKLDIVKQKRLKLIGNPQIFQLNEIIFGNANFDVARDMILNSIRSQHGKAPTDWSLEMLLQQRSFYPILPNLVNSEDAEKIEKVITVDQRKMKDLFIGVLPDVIITPSANIGAFAKKIGSTLFINPSSLTKIKDGELTGSMIKMSVHSPNNHTGTDIQNRLRVEILKVSGKK